MKETQPPVVSVITPSLNQGRFIEETIRSVLAQDCSGVEHIVVDGGSTDDTPAIVRRYPQLRWLSEPDGGQSDAINKGLRLARGEILGWLNSDDTYLPGTLRAAVDGFRDRRDVDLVYGDCYVVDEIGTPLDVRRSTGYTLARLLTLDATIPQPGTFFRRRAIDRVGGLDATLHLVMDLDLHLRVARHGRIAYVPGVGATYRTHGNAKSTAQAHAVLDEVLRVLERTFADPSLPRDLARLRREALGAALVYGGIRAYNTGDRRHARRLLLRGLCQYPNPFRLRTLKALLLLGDTLAGTALGGRLRALLHRRALRRELASCEAPFRPSPDASRRGP